MQMCLTVGVIGGCIMDVCAFEIALRSLSKKKKKTVTRRKGK